MRWLHLDPLPLVCLNPSAKNPAAGKNQDMHAASTDYGEFEVAIKRRVEIGCQLSCLSIDVRRPRRKSA
jgi:hypothetical protein